MSPNSRFPSIFLFLFGLLILCPALGAQAQRAGQGAPNNDPFGRRVVPARAVPGGRYQSHSFANGVLTVKATDGSARQIAAWTYDVVKISYFAPGHIMGADSSVSVVQKPYKWALAEIADYQGNKAKYPPVYATSTTIRLAVSGGDIVIDKNSLQVSVLRHRDNPPRLDRSGKPMYTSLVRIQDTVFREASPAFRRQSLAGAGAAATSAPDGTAVRFRLAPGERLYGTGSRALPLDRRGYRLELYNQAHYGSQNNEPNLNITLPTVLSSRGYMLFFDHHAPGYLDLGKTDKNVLEYSAEGLTSLSYFVITGRDQAEILDRYTALTGRQPLPPRWALGLIQSRFGYKTEAEMQQVATRMRRENFPLDALVLDLYWFGGTTKQGDFDWHRPSFPNPAGMMSSLKEKGIKTILISEPYVMRTSRNDSLVRTQGLIGTTTAGQPFTVASFWAGPASILDVFKPKTRTWMWSQYKRLHDQGAAGWWSDLGEPENHPEAMRHANGSARAVHNAYGQEWARIIQDNYTQEFPAERVFNLARSGWAGMQRNSVFPWSGDIQRSWSGYKAQIPVMLGMGQGGVGYMHSDAGGFCVGGIDSELYTRWLQMASLCPILRPHGEGVPPEPYYYPNPYKSSVRNAVHLRYQLLPYLYTLAWQNTITGAPLARSMDYGSDSGFQLKFASTLQFSDYEHSKWRPTTRPERQQAELLLNATVTERLAKANDQYLLGPNLLVAPVLNPSQRRRNVVLPRGTWIDFYSNQTYAGGGTAGIAAPLAHAPLLVRAGAFLPMTAYRPSTDQYRPDTLLLCYYPDPNTPQSGFTMYDDDGHSARALAQKQFETLTMRGAYTAGQTDVLLSRTGRYTGQPATRLVRLLVQRVAAPPTAVYLDEKPAPAGTSNYDPVRHELEVRFPIKEGTVVSLRGLKILAEQSPHADPETLTLEAPDNRTFSPRGTTLRYTRHAEGTADAPVLLLIRNAQGDVVRVFSLATSPGPHSLAWNGLDDQNHPVAPGVYVAEAGEQHQRLIVTP